MSLYPRREETVASNGMVATKHPLAAEAGVQMAQLRIEKQ